MATVVVPIEAFRTGLFPHMCAKTGARADTLVDVAAGTTPGRLVRVIGLWIPPVAAIGRVVPGRLPYSPDVTARRALGRRVSRVAMPVSIAAWLGSAFVAPLYLLSLVALAIAVWATSVALGTSVRAVVVAEGHSVRLHGVAPAFVEAVRGQGLAVDR